MVTIQGTPTDDLLQGTLDSDLILAVDGNDSLIGNGGDDTLFGGSGSAINIGEGSDRDLLQGGEGNDLLFGSAGFDTATGDAGDDTIFAGKDNDIATGGTGNDRIFGDRGLDFLDGGDGDDTISGGTGILETNNGDDADRIQGGSGNDSLLGNLGSDTIEGGDGDDTIYGGQQNDVISGGSGNDVIFGDRAIRSIGINFDLTNFPVDGAPFELLANDLDRDGDTDLLVGRSRSSGSSGLLENDIALLRNNGDGTFANPISLADLSGSFPLAIADLDGDDDADIVTTGNNRAVLLFRNDGSGTFGDPETYVGTGFASIGDTADIDGDGDLDLITLGDQRLDPRTSNPIGTTISIHFNDGEGRFGVPETLTVGNGVRAATAADLNGDGHLELIASNQSDDRVAVLSNDGNEVFAPLIPYATGIRPVGTVAADLDNDGDLDLAVPNFGRSLDTPGTVSILRNDGNGRFAPTVSFATESLPSSLKAADLDNDGDLDLIMRHSFRIISSGERRGNSISVLRNDGTGVFSAPEVLPVGNVPIELIAEDLNGDSALDIAIANLDSRNVSVYLNTETTTAGDTLTGGAGADDFVFENLSAAGDIITDFQPGEDRILVDAASFGLTPGSISVEQFATGNSATNERVRFVYDNASGGLFFDPDGSGISQTTLLVTLDGASSLSAADILSV